MNGLILTTVLITAGSTELARSIHTSKGKTAIDWNPSMRPVIAAFILGAFLLGIDEVAPDIATKLCILIIVSALLINGTDVFKLASTF